MAARPRREVAQIEEVVVRLVLLAWVVAHHLQRKGSRKVRRGLTEGSRKVAHHLQRLEHVLVVPRECCDPLSHTLDRPARASETAV